MSYEHPRVRAHTSVLPIRLLLSDALMRQSCVNGIRLPHPALDQIDALPADEAPDPVLLSALLAHPDERVVIAALKKVRFAITPTGCSVLLRRLELAHLHDGTIWSPAHVAMMQVLGNAPRGADASRFSAATSAVHDRYVAAIPTLGAEETRHAAQLALNEPLATVLLRHTSRPEVLFEVASFTDWLRDDWRALIPKPAGEGCSVNTFKALLPQLAEFLSAPLVARLNRYDWVLSDLAELESALRSIKRDLDPTYPTLANLLDEPTLTTLVEQIVKSEAFVAEMDEQVTQSHLELLARLLVDRPETRLALTTDFLRAVLESPWEGVRETGATLAQYL